MSFGEFSTFVFCQERGGRLAKWGPEGAFRGHQHHFQFSTNSKGHQPAPAAKVGAPGPKWRHCPTQRPTLATYFSLALCNNCSFCPGEQIGILSQLPASPILRSGYELFWVTVPDEGQPGVRVVHRGWWLIIGDYPKYPPSVPREAMNAHTLDIFPASLSFFWSDLRAQFVPHRSINRLKIHSYI